MTGVKWDDAKIKYNVSRFYRNRQGYQAHVEAVLPLSALLSTSLAPSTTGFPSFLPFRVYPCGTVPPCVLVAGHRVSDWWFRLDALTSTKVQLSLRCPWQVVVKKVQCLLAFAGDTTNFQSGFAHYCPGGLVPLDSGRTGDSDIVKWIITQTITSVLMDPGCLGTSYYYMSLYASNSTLLSSQFTRCSLLFRWARQSFYPTGCSTYAIRGTVRSLI